MAEAAPADPSTPDALADAGGVPFDDEAPDEPGSRRAAPGAPAYDSGKVLRGRGIGYPDRTPVGMGALAAFLQRRWGGTNLGCLSKPPRPMRGGDQPSLHCWGMALDWRWAGPGPGRAAADEMIDFFLEHTGPLGVQAVHDYERCRYWKSYSGWKTATKSGSTGFGQPWAQWLHIERTWAAANDDRSIEQALRDVGSSAASPKTPVEPASAGTPADAVILPDPVLRRGDRGADVARLQDFVRFFRFADFARSDGEFGPRTEAAVRRAQTELAARRLPSVGGRRSSSVARSRQHRRSAPPPSSVGATIPAPPRTRTRPPRTRRGRGR